MQADIDAIEASLVGVNSFTPTTNYAVSTIGRSIQDGLVNVMWFLSETERAQVKANGTTLDLTTKINAAKTWAGNRPLYMPAGTWSFTSLSFVGNLGGIVGDGIGNTILKARSAVAAGLDFHENSDVNPSAFTLKGFTLDGSSVVTTGIDIRFRHQYTMDGLYVINCTNGIVEKDTYLARHHNVRVRLCTTGMWLVGSNHSSTYVGCTLDGMSGTSLLVQSLGTAADGNSGLTFTGCDIEFGTGTARGADISCTDITFSGCYLGENIPGPVITMRAGMCTISGGSMFFGHTSSSYLVNPLGGKVLFVGAAVNGQSVASASMLSGTGTAGKISFRDCLYNGLVSGSPFLAGDVLDYGPQCNVFAPRLGKNWTGEGNNVTFSSAVSGNKLSLACLTALGPSPLLGARAPLSNISQWRDGETLYCVLVYESSKPINVILSGGPFGVGPTKTVQATLPASSGGPYTGICLQVAADSAAYLYLEAIQTSTAVGDTLVIYECCFSDSRMLDKLSGQFGNFYKC